MLWQPDNTANFVRASSLQGTMHLRAAGFTTILRRIVFSTDDASLRDNCDLQLAV